MIDGTGIPASGYTDESTDKRNCTGTTAWMAAMLLLPSLGLVPIVASAQQTDDPLALEEVVVTSERREATLQTSPVSVSVLSGAFVEDARITDPSSLTAHIPNLGFAKFDRVQAVPSLRGAQTFDDSPGIELPVAVFIDEISYGRVTDWDLAMFDVDRVEVLKGPQGALYGRNVTGGVIKILSRRPHRDFEASGELSLGRFDDREVRGLINGSVGANVSGRLAVVYHERDGYTRNPVSGSDLDSIDKISARGQLLFEISPTLSALLQIGTVQDDGFGQTRDYVGSPLTAPDFLGVATDNDPDTALNAFDGGLDRSATNVSATVDFKLDAATFTSITGYFDDDTSMAPTDIAASPVPLLWETNEFTVKQFSQEFRLVSAESDSPWSWLGGVYYLNIDHARDRNFFHQLRAGTFLGDLQAAFFGNNDMLGLQTHMEVETESYSGYAQVSYAINDRANLTAGGRYTRDEKSGTLTNKGDSFLFLGAGPYIDLPLKDSWSEFTPKITADFNFTPDVMGYVTWARGFKSGGWTAFNPDANGPEDMQDAFDPETAENFEVGLKTRWLEDRLQINANTYHVDYQDLQVAINDDTGGFIVTNAGKASAKGIDLEVLARPARGLEMWLNYSYFDGEFTAGPFDGAAMPSPSDSYTAGFAYSHPAGGGELRFRADVQYKDLYPQEPGEGAVEIGLDNIVNAGISWMPNDRWEVELWGRNLTDDRSNTYLNDFAPFYFSEAELGAGATGMTANYIEPRSYGVSFRLKFN